MEDGQLRRRVERGTARLVDQNLVLRNGRDDARVSEFADQVLSRRVVDVRRVDAGGVAVLGKLRFLELFMVSTRVVVRIGTSSFRVFILNTTFRPGLHPLSGILLKAVAVLHSFKMASLIGYIECLNCGFVTYSKNASSPEPRTWDACPDCGSTEFDFTGR